MLEKINKKKVTKMLTGGKIFGVVNGQGWEVQS